MTHNPRQILPVTLRTDAGKFLEAWQIVGTSIVYFGQEGEQLARECAAALDEAEAVRRRRERIGD